MPVDHLTIPIPDGMPEDQKADLAGWLTDLVKRVARGSEPVRDDPESRARVAARMKRGIAEIDAGQGMDARQSLREIADEFGINLDR